MTVNTIPYIEEMDEAMSYGDESYDARSCGQDQEENSSIWIKNLEHLDAVAAILRSDAVEVANPKEAKRAFEQHFGGLVEHPRKVVLNGYSEALQCRFKRFLNLPYEIRQHIWVFAMRAEEYSYGSVHLQDRLEVRNFVRKNTIGTSPRDPSFLPKVCRVSNFTRQETIEVFLQRTLFHICAIEQNRFMHSFLDHAPNGFGAVRRLQFAFFDCFPSGFDVNADLELAVRCPGLQELQISFHDKKLFRWSGPDDHSVALPRLAQEMWSYYKMDRMLEFGVCLKKLTILRKGYGSDYADRGALEFARFVTHKFQEVKGRLVQADVVGNRYVLALND